MLRYEKYNYILQSLQISKHNLNKTSDLVIVNNLEVQAGHFKLNGFFVEHAIMLLLLTGQMPKSKLFKHGKKLKNTVLLSSIVSSKNKWMVMDKFITEVMPLVSDMSVKPYGRYGVKSPSNLYSFRLRQFFELDEFSSLMTDRVLRKDVFLPLFFNIYTSSAVNNFNETYLRMLRFPISLKNKQKI